jgi:pimeloyl-ACP methyl ester carboxylesterase
MPQRKQILFIQGGGPGVHDDWDQVLVESLADALGSSHEVLYPRMPTEDDPSYALWGPAIEHELAGLNDGAVVVGHSVGGTVLIDVLAKTLPQCRLEAIVLLAAPFVGAGGWPGDEFELPEDLGRRLPEGVAVHVCHGLEDSTVPPAHADLFAQAIPQARVHRLPGQDHQFNGDLSQVADVIEPTGPVERGRSATGS